MTLTKMCIGIAIMALVTYLPRVLPLVIFKKPIENRFVQLILAQVPYAVLAAMIFPDALYSTASMLSAVIGIIVAILLAYWERGLITVALGATAAVFLAERLLPFFL